jgi:hypothetical protein
MANKKNVISRTYFHHVNVDNGNGNGNGGKVAA